MEYRWSICTLAVVAALGAFSAQAAPRYRIQDLGSIQGGIEDIFPRAINEAGEVVGGSARQSGTSKLAAFIYRNGDIRPLVPIGAWNLAYDALDINDHGVAAGAFWNRETGIQPPVVFSNGSAIDVGTLPGGSRWVSNVRINNAGVVIGMEDNRPFIHEGTSSRELKIEGLNRPIGVMDINDHGVILGATQGRGFHFLYDGTNYTRLPRVPWENSNFLAVALNNAGQVLGQLQIHDEDDSFTQAAVFDNGQYRPLGPLEPIDDDVIPYGFNNKGWAVGTVASRAPGSGVFAAVWRNGERLNLNEVGIQDPDGPVMQLYAAQAINNRGQIVGWGRVEGSYWAHGFIATPVPEAGTWALLLAGLGLMGWRARRARPASLPAPAS